MKIWLVTIGEPVPVKFGTNDRLHRTGFFAHLLARKGHNVTWWTSAFDHMRKAHYFGTDQTVPIGENLTIKLLAGPGYKNNISVKRMYDHLSLSCKFKSHVDREKQMPDVILSSLPTISLCSAAVSYGKKNDIPVVLDMRDMWPDIFLEIVPKNCRPLLKLVLAPLFYQARKACSGATAITGITDTFVEWGLKRGRRKRTSLDKPFPLGYISVQPDEDALIKASDFWDESGLDSNRTDKFIACFIGTMGQVAEIEAVIGAAKILVDKNFLFVLGGTGERLDYYKKISTPNVIFPGWINAAQINVLLRRSSIGLNPLPDRFDFTSTINNKVFEYMSSGLPVIASPEKGILHDFLKQNRCGMSYANGDAGALARILTELRNNPLLLRELSDNSKKIYETSFRAEKVYVDMEAYLQDVISSHEIRT